jgi:hypothetical protein
MAPKKKNRFESITAYEASIRLIIKSEAIHDTKHRMEDRGLM